MKYTKTHEWITVSDSIGTVGITEHAQEALGDIVFVELPEVGLSVKAGDELGVVESVKAASDYYAPVSGTIVAVNEALVDTPETINESAETAGWFVKIQLTNEAETEALLDEAAYKALEA